MENYPLEIKDMESELNEELLKYFTGENTSGFVRVGPKRYVLPHGFREEAANIYNMPIRPDDIFVLSFPRSGTTWTQELVWMVANDLDYAGSNATTLTQRFPYLERKFTMQHLLERLKENRKNDEAKLKIIAHFTTSVVDQLAQTPSPRFVKSHLPVSLLPPTLLDTAKVVYVARDPRDVVVSFYHLNQLQTYRGYIGDFNSYWNFFHKDLIGWTPYFEHVKEAWESRHHPNMLFLFYEELTQDLPAAVRRVAKFLNKEFTDAQIEKLCEHLSFDNFKNNKSVNLDSLKEFGIFAGDQSFIRKGKVGGWRDYFDDEMMQQMNTWMEHNLRDTDFRFQHLQTESKKFKDTL